MQNKKIAAVLGMLVAGLLTSGIASAALTVTPITWNVIGLDSNAPASGPRRFPVGARVCSNIATTGVNVNFELATANPYVNVRSGSLTNIVIPALAAGACSDAYFEVEVAANPAAYGTTERYRITANDGTGLVSTPVPRELFVERLVSQARNDVSDVKVNGVSIPAGGTMSLMVGSVYDITLVGSTATQGYNQLESFINFPNTVFQVLSVATTYSVGGASNRLYADACGWENNPASPNYRSCVVSDNKAGGSVNTVYTVRIIGGGGTAEPLNTLIYDFSGSSYHYNADYGVGARIAQIVNASSLGFAKAFAPAATVAGGTSTLTFTISNPNAGAVTGLNFVDSLPSSPAQMVVATPLTVSTSGCGAGSVTTVAGGTSISFANGAVAANSSCTVSVRVSVPAAPTSGSYVNTSQPLFVGTTSTGNSASATLNLTTTPPPTLSCGIPMAQWNFVGYAANPPAPSTVGANVGTAAISVGNGLTNVSDTSAGGGNPQPGMRTYGWQGNTPINTATSAFVQFAIDTDSYSGIVLALNAQRTNPGPTTSALYYSTDGVTWNFKANFSATTAWLGYGPFDFTGQTNTGGVTYFRIYGNGANNTNSGSDVTFDNVSFTGCGSAQHPTIAKAFAPASIPLAGGVSTLTFTLVNPNATQLTGVRFTDSLPAGVQVASPPAAATTCGGSPTWAPTASTTTLAFGQTTGATIPGSGSCTVSVNVTGTTSGAKVNVSDFISSTESGTNTGPTGSATATLTVEPALLPPVAVKSFAPDVIASGGRSMLTITITNPNTLHTLTGLAIADTYPAALANANPLLPAPTNTCGGTLTAVAGGNSLSLSGGSIPPGSNCAIEVPVTSAIVGDHVNTTGAVSAAVVGSGNSTNATLSVDPAAPALRLSKQVRIAVPPGPWLDSVVVAPGASLEYRFIVENIGNVPVSGVTVTDPLLTGAGVSLAACSWALIPVASAVDDPTVTCIVGPLSPAAAGVNTNTATAQGTYAAAPVVSMPDQATYFGAVPGLSLTKQIGLSATGPWLPSLTVAAGTNVFYRFTIANNGNTTFTGVSISDPSPAIDESQCTYVDPLPPGGVSVCTLGPVAAGGAGGSTTTNTATASGTDGGGTVTTPSSSASYTIQAITADVSLVKTLVTAGPFTIGQSIAYTLQVANAGPSTATSVQVTDTPTNLTITGVSGGGCAALPCTIPALASGASVTINVTATINAAGAFDNAATALATETDPNLANNTDNSGNGGTAGALADVSLVKTLVTAGPFTIGQSIAYTLQVGNAGPSTATSVQVTDTPTNLTITGVSGGGCTALPCTIPALASGASVTINVTATINAAGAFDNAATALATETDPNLANNTDNSGNGGTAGALADVSLVKTLVTAGPFTIGQSISYTLQVANAGPSTATSVQVTDTPSNLTITGVSGGGCAALPCTIPSLASGASVTINVTATINAAGAFDNAATALATETDPNLANNTDNSGNGGTAGALADVSLVKTLVTTGPFTIGQSIAYTLQVGNAGPSTATSVQVTDTPTNLTITGVSGGGCTALPCTIPALASGASVTINVTATINAAGAFDNAATALATETDPNLANNTDNSGNGGTAGALADVSLVKTLVTAGPFTIGQSISYTLQVGNAGPSTATSVQVTDTPTNLAITSVSGGGCAALPCTIPSLASGASVTINVTATINAAGAFDNAATALATETDPNLANNTDNSGNGGAAGAVADLSITKTNGASSVVPGGTTTYLVVVANAGPSPASGASVVDTFPAAITAASWTAVGANGATCPASGAGSINATVNLPVGGSCTFTIVATISAGATGTLSNTATVTPPAGVTDPVLANNSATDSDPIVPTPVVADLSVTKTDGVATVVAGATTTYTIVVANAGPDAAPNATLTDTLPAQATFNSLAAPAGWSCVTPAVGTTGTVTCSNPSFASGGSATFTLAVTVGAATPSGTTLTNTAIVASGASDPTPGNNTATDVDTVTASADLSVLKSNGVNGVTSGTPTTYTVTVTNNGPSTVTGAILSDPVAAGLTKTAVACAAPPGTCVSAPTVGQLEAGFALPALASGATYRITVTANVTAASGSVSNTATVTPPAGVTDPTPGNNSSTDTDPVTPASVVADLSVTKTDGVATVVAGATTTYTIVVANAGPDAAPNATLTDTLPAQATFNSLAAPAGWSCVTPAVGATGTVTCSNPSFASGGSATFTLAVTVGAATPSGTTLTNTAIVASGASDPTPGNNTATDVDTVTASADLSVLKSNGVNGVTSGTPTTYTVTVTNNGPSTVTGAILSDPLATGLTKTAVTCAPAPGQCVTAPSVAQLEAGFALPALASGATYAIAVTANVTATTGNVSNTATIAAPAGVVDPVPGNNSSTDTDPVTPTSTVADLTIVKTNNVTQLVPGGTVIYTLVVTNLGPGEVSGATVTDIAPSSLTFGVWTCSVTNPGAGGSVTTACVTGSGVGNVVATVDMKVGAVLTFTVPATVSAGATGTIVNSASVAAPPGITDPVGNNNAATETDPVAGGSPTEVPTLSEWALMLLSLMLAMLGLRARRASA